MDEKSSKYGQWTKDALIARIRALEQEIRSSDFKAQTSSVAAQQQAETAKETAEVQDSSAEPQKKKQKKERKIDPSRYTTRLIALKLAYLGKNYGGFEFQASSQLTTIEEELWKALVKSCLIFPENPDVVDFEPWEYSKCGRTDKGVSAFGQVIGIRVRSNRPVRKKPKENPTTDVSQQEGSVEVEMPDAPEEGIEGKEKPPPQKFDDFADEIQYPRVLNRLLPPDIRILAWCPTTPEDFSARHHCRERQYRYFFTQPAYSPVPYSLQDPSPASSSMPTTTKSKRGRNGRRSSLNSENKKSQAGNESEIKRPRDGYLDLDAMRTAAKKFEGLHDFRNFCKIDGAKNQISYERRIFESDIVEATDAETGIPHLLGPEFSSSTTSTPSSSSQKDRLPKIYYFHVRGSAFLWHQIRCMVSVLLLVAQGLESPTVIDRLLDIDSEPRRPSYVLADEVPLVLWDCKFPKNLDDPLRPDDALPWIRLGEDNPLYYHGFTGLSNSLWESWRERKMDEILSAQLLSVVSSGTTDLSRRLDPKAPRYAPDVRKLFLGGNADVSSGKRYIPLLERTRLASPAEAYDKEAQRKGFRDLAHMREVQAQLKAEAAAAAGKLPAITATQHAGEDEE
ncbi:pseudouridine synthase [Xylariaceae sp. FL0255]|nr:pseudouridine synthase [Xylariaceae sp. FL0255]